MLCRKEIILKAEGSRSLSKFLFASTTSNTDLRLAKVEADKVRPNVVFVMEKMRELILQN